MQETVAIAIMMLVLALAGAMGDSPARLPTVADGGTAAITRF